MRALVTGGTGFIGRNLLVELSEARILSRNAQRAQKKLPAGVEVFPWNPTGGPPPSASLEGVDVVFNLVGETIGERWTAEKKQRIHESRALSTRHLVEGIAARDDRPKVLVSSSAIGIYGDRDDDWLSESAVIGTGFLADVCRDWEREAQEAEKYGVRVVLIRTGLVFGSDGGVLESMLKPIRLGVASRLGSGKQWISWIHISDLVAMMIWAARNEEISGPLNAVSPNPVTNAQFTRMAAKLLRRPVLMPPTPRFALRAALGEMSSLLFESQRVRPGVALDEGFVFKHPELEGALKRILNRK